MRYQLTTAEGSTSVKTNMDGKNIQVKLSISVSANMKPLSETSCLGVIDVLAGVPTTPCTLTLLDHYFSTSDVSHFIKLKFEYEDGTSGEDSAEIVLKATTPYQFLPHVCDSSWLQF